MNIGKHLIITIDEMFISYEVVDSNNREWMNGRERKSLDQQQCLQQITQLIRHKHEHYTLTGVQLEYSNVDLDQKEFKRLLQNQITVTIK